MSFAARKFTISPILGLKVIQGHRCWYHWKARRQCLLCLLPSFCNMIQMGSSKTAAVRSRLRVV